MIKQLLKSVREYKKPSLLAPAMVSLEVVMEVIIPFIIARLINKIKAGCTLQVIIMHGLLLVVLALLSLTFGILSGNFCAQASCGFAKNLRQDIYPDAKNQLIGKDPDAGKDRRWEEKGMTEDEMVGWHH